MIVRLSTTKDCPVPAIQPGAKELWEKWKGKEIQIGQTIDMENSTLGVEKACDSDTVWEVTGPEELLMALWDLYPDAEAFGVCRHMLDIGD